MKSVPDLIAPTWILVAVWYGPYVYSHKAPIGLSQAICLRLLISSCRSTPPTTK